MPLTRKDTGFIVIAAAILAVLLVSTLRDKSPKLPTDDKHKPFREALARGDRREAVEKGCPTCHNPGAMPLPPRHPPKEQCLICHK
jgi:hypothetical protein